MKVIFLDFDGVLNNTSSLYLRTLNIYFIRTDEFEAASLAAPNKTSVDLMNLLVRISNAKIVVSSSWRHLMSVEQLRICLRNEFGLLCAYRGYNDKDPVIIDKIKHTEKKELRGRQIKKWLDTHPEVTDYVIIDDDTDMLREQSSHFVYVNPKSGFSDKDFDHALDILKIPKSWFA